MDDKIMQLKKWIDESDNVVFFGGAGVSTESGIPDFRSVDGLYNQKWKYPRDHTQPFVFCEIPRGVLSLSSGEARHRRS